MDKLKQWVALAVVGALGIVAVGWFLLVSPKKSEATDLEAQVTEQQSTNAGLRNQVDVLKAKAKDLPREQAKLAAVSQKIPANPALPALIRALTAASDGANVEFVSLTPGAPAPAAAATTAAAAPVAADSGSTDGAAATTSAATPASDLQVIPVAINVVGGYYDIQAFAAALENLSRAVRVTVLAVAPGANPLEKQDASASPADQDGSVLTATITGEAFMSTPVATAASTGGAAPVATSTVSVPAGTTTQNN